MTYIVKRGATFTPAPEGLHNAVCVDIVDLGIKETKFGKKEKLRIVWELDATTAGVLSDGRRFIVQKHYTPSLHEKATLHKDLKSWRGRAFTNDELAGFDLENIVNAPCKLLIEHNDVEGTTYANVVVITKADKDSKLLPSGEYTRVKDRPEKENGGKYHEAPMGEDMDGVPF